MTESLLHLCRTCGRYTFADACPEGHGPTRTPHPARYSPHDRWGKYRRALYAAAAKDGV
jgi:H/ACA ribonucleoprotein complex subunit 3